DLNVARDRAAFLRKTRHVQHADALAFPVGRHAQPIADSDAASTADARYQDPVGVVVQSRERGQGNFGQARRFIRTGLGVGAGRDVTHSGLTRFSAFQCHETWAIAFDAGEVLVARGLIDASLRAPRGLQWLYG